MRHPPLAWAALALLAVAPLTLQADERPSYVEHGEASWYGAEFDGNTTSSGEPFDSQELTAAHPELPLGAEVEVTNVATGRSVEVEINDRGPCVDGRAIDLSEAAAEQLDMLDEGVAPVRIEADPRELAVAERTQPHDATGC